MVTGYALTDSPLPQARQAAKRRKLPSDASCLWIEHAKRSIEVFGHRVIRAFTSLNQCHLRSRRVATSSRGQQNISVRQRDRKRDVSRARVLMVMFGAVLRPTITSSIFLSCFNAVSGRSFILLRYSTIYNLSVLQRVDRNAAGKFRICH